MKYLLVIPMTLIASFAAYNLKRGTESADGILSWFTIPRFYVGGALYMSNFLITIWLLRFIDYTILYPMGVLTYVWSQLIANRFMGEPITRNKIIGIIIIFVGMILITR